MQLNSYLFLLLFFPVTTVLYFALSKSRTAANRFLILASLIFYSAAGWQCMIILIISMVCNWFLGRKLAARPEKPLLTFSLCINILALLYCKYLNFFLSAVGGILAEDIPTLSILLPLGISFYTFNQISFLIDCFRGEIPTASADDYALYILFFPKLIMGPLVTYRQFVPQFHRSERCRPNVENLVAGLQMLSFGLFKKAMLADVFGQAANAGFAKPDAASTATLWMAVLCYTLQIYFDFSGYSDMALGCARILNIELPLNFDSPYQAVSIRGFWKRWHMSLTSFFTKYVYFPLGGSRAGTAITCRNILIVFLISGLWHGANWTFLLWGALHGLLQIFERFCRTDRLPEFLRRVLTLLAVSLLWALFRADSISQWMEILQGLFVLRSGTLSPSLLGAFHIPEWKFLMRSGSVARLVSRLPWFPAASIVFPALALCLFCKNACRRSHDPGLSNLLLSLAALILGITAMTSQSVFVYMNF